MLTGYVRNGRLARKLIAAGYRSLADAALALKVTKPKLFALLTLSESPLDAKQQPTKVVLKIAEGLGCDVRWLFPDEYLVNENADSFSSRLRREFNKRRRRQAAIEAYERVNEERAQRDLERSQEWARQREESRRQQEKELHDWRARQDKLVQAMLAKPSVDDEYVDLTAQPNIAPSLIKRDRH